MDRNILLTLEDEDAICEVGRAVSAKLRVQMLKLLNSYSMNVNELAEKLDIPVSTAAFHVNVLADAGLIFAAYQPGARGAQKLCSRKLDRVQIDFGEKPDIAKMDFTTISMPVGCYSNCYGIKASCGLVSEVGYIDVDDEPKAFFNPSHYSAQLIWFSEGVLEYKFPSTCLANSTAQRIQFSLELCSEVSNYRNDWPSDITVWINDKEICTYLSPGDFGGRKGRFSPEWWSETYTQFGLLKTFSVDSRGVTIDNVFASPIKIEELELEKGECISFKIGVKENAVNRGGINIFGEKFGDYEQNIVMRVDYMQNSAERTSEAEAPKKEN